MVIAGSEESRFEEVRMMEKLDFGDRIAQILVGLAALFGLASGAFMLWNPYGWYLAIPTVRFTGPPNFHFIRDIGLAYLAMAAILGFAALNLRTRWLAAFAGSIWLALHGGLHIYEVLNGICAPGAFWQDAPIVIGQPLLVWIALAILFARRRIGPTLVNTVTKGQV
jgi:hypothetical protein